MKRHFKAVRTAFLLAVLTILGAVGGALTRGYLSDRPTGDADSPTDSLISDDGAASVLGASPESDDVDSPAANPDSQNRTDDPQSASVAGVPVGTLLASGTQAAANALLQGDLMLQEGRVSEAVRHFRHLLAEAVTDTAMMDVRYRLALCAEALSNHEEALSNYQKVVQAADAGVLKELSWLGQARVFFKRREIPSAQQLLRLWVLQENEPAIQSRLVSHEALYLLGTVSADVALSDQEARLWEDEGLAQPRRSFEPHELLPAAFAADVREQAEVPVGIQLLHQLQVSEPGSSYFQGRLARTSVHRVLQQVCDGARWQLEFGPTAEKTLRAQTIQLNFSEKSADLLFDLLLAPLGMAWTFDSERLRVVAESEMDDGELGAYRRSLAERMLFVALLSDPEHQQSPTAYLLLGNLSFEGHDLPTSRRHFENILQTYPRSTVAAEAWFNAAKVATAEGNMERARQALLGAVDVARGNPLEPVALLLSARNALLFDEPLKAVRPLVRAVTLATEDDVRALSLLTLASAHLIAGHPESANVALMEDRRLLQHEAYRDRTALLGSLARFHAASTPWRIDRDGRSLIASLSHSRVEEWFTLHDHLLTIEAFETVGLTDLALPVLESAVQDYGTSPLRTRMKFHLAELYAGRGESDRAEIVLATMTEHPSPEIATQSLLALADLHVRRKEADRAELICRDLLQQPLSEERRIAVLRLLGGIYARRGDRERAVLCYSGVAPQLFEATLRTSPNEASRSLPDDPGVDGAAVSEEQEARP